MFFYYYFYGNHGYCYFVTISVPGNMLRTKVGKMMETFVSGLWGAKLVMEYEKFFNEEVSLKRR